MYPLARCCKVFGHDVLVKDKVFYMYYIVLITKYYLLESQTNMLYFIIEFKRIVALNFCVSTLNWVELTLILGKCTWIGIDQSELNPWPPGGMYSQPPFRFSLSMENSCTRRGDLRSRLPFHSKELCGCYIWKWEHEANSISHIRQHNAHHRPIFKTYQIL